MIRKYSSSDRLTREQRLILPERILLCRRLWENDMSPANWVLTRGWRTARYVNEPRVRPPNGYVHVYATACEVIARGDANFAATHDTVFYRPLLRKPGPHTKKKLSGLPKTRRW
ncbi:hypothetical protein BO71DRAFT_412813 [Aspergillus ellipticus CBS 707.79]|uniref:Uncharacterized protein n=1 Tax=Aspergillus ellipticus CBS 707.79 TaxID=1448320 RepID=A0A319EGU9_9EURO|nr:hypothetical protein BO71DRAFT_412813 [Aspergillus ellipticus CBS 707.79]